MIFGAFLYLIQYLLEYLLELRLSIDIPLCLTYFHGRLLRRYMVDPGQYLRHNKVYRVGVKYYLTGLDSTREIVRCICICIRNTSISNTQLVKNVDAANVQNQNQNITNTVAYVERIYFALTLNALI